MRAQYLIFLYCFINWASNSVHTSKTNEISNKNNVKNISLVNEDAGLSVWGRFPVRIKNGDSFNFSFCNNWKYSPDTPITINVKFQVKNQSNDCLRRKIDWKSNKIINCDRCNNSTFCNFQVSNVFNCSANSVGVGISVKNYSTKIFKNFNIKVDSKRRNERNDRYYNQKRRDKFKQKRDSSTISPYSEENIWQGFVDLDEDLEFPSGNEGAKPVVVEPPENFTYVADDGCPKCVTDLPSNLTSLYCSSQSAVKFLVIGTININLKVDMSKHKPVKYLRNSVSLTMNYYCRCLLLDKVGMTGYLLVLPPRSISPATLQQLHLDEYTYIFSSPNEINMKEINC